MEMMSKILIIGGTGYIGKFIVEASASVGHSTFVLVRKTTASNPAKARLLETFKASGVTFLYVDIVISTIGESQLAHQVNIIDAIKKAGHIKRFFPSEFGVDEERAHNVEPLKSAVDVKIRIRRATEKSGIPYTIVCPNYFAGYSLPTLAQAEAMGPPTDKVVILGDGNTKAIFVDEKDIGTYTIKAVDDPRTLNKILYLRPPENIYTQNELVALWEKKTGNTLERTYLSEEEVLERIKVISYPFNFMLAINYSVLVKGDTTNFEIKPSFGVEATELYPDVKYTTVDEYLSRLV